MYCVFLKSHFLSRDVLRKYMRAAKVEELSVANCTFSPPSKSLFKKNPSCYLHTLLLVQFMGRNFVNHDSREEFSKQAHFL